MVLVFAMQKGLGGAVSKDRSRPRTMHPSPGAVFRWTRVCGRAPEGGLRIHIFRDPEPRLFPLGRTVKSTCCGPKAHRSFVSGISDVDRNTDEGRTTDHGTRVTERTEDGPALVGGGGDLRDGIAGAVEHADDLVVVGAAWIGANFQPSRTSGPATSEQVDRVTHFGAIVGSGRARMDRQAKEGHPRKNTWYPPRKKHLFKRISV